MFGPSADVLPRQREFKKEILLQLFALLHLRNRTLHCITPYIFIIANIVEFQLHQEEVAGVIYVHVQATWNQ